MREKFEQDRLIRVAVKTMNDRVTHNTQSDEVVESVMGGVFVSVMNVKTFGLNMAGLAKSHATAQHDLSKSAEPRFVPIASHVISPAFGMKPSALSSVVFDKAGRTHGFGRERFSAAGETSSLDAQSGPSFISYLSTCVKTVVAIAFRLCCKGSATLAKASSVVAALANGVLMQTCRFCFSTDTFVNRHSLSLCEQERFVKEVV